VGDDVRLVSADDREWSDRFSTLVVALRRFQDRELVIEGFICALGEDGRPSFDVLKSHDASKASRVMFFATDVHLVGDDDLRALPAPERRARLEQLLTNVAPPIVLSPAPTGAIDHALAAVSKLGVPAIVARALDARADTPLVAVAAAEKPLLLSRSLSPPPAITNADKVLYPRDGYRKRDIVAYYDDVAPVLLRHLEDRVVVGQRWPDGIDDFTWYQHRPPPRAPDYLRAARIDGDPRIRVDCKDALLWLVNQAALTFHTWPSRVSSLTEPNWVIFDLDPGESTQWEDTIAIATALRHALELLELASVPKTSGKKGLHVLVPIGPGHSVEQAHDLAHRVALVLARHAPDKTCLETDKEKRRGRLLVDHVQGYIGKSLVAPYSLRAADGAPVSCPLAWSEVGLRLDPKAFTMRTMRARLDAHGDLAAPLLAGTARLEAALSKL
jgi:DNA ligase D-like protein (predicted polymerase)